MNIDAPHSSQFPALKNLWQEAFNDTEAFVDAFWATAFSPDRCRIVTLGPTETATARIITTHCKIPPTDCPIAAALYWFDCLHMGRRVAYLYAVATARAFRGRGICHHLMVDTHRHLARAGYEGTILVPGTEALFRFYEDIGYQTFCHIHEFHCVSSPDAYPLLPIHKAEYARLRRLFLPKGGVIQENENLDFLQTQAKFYTGPGVLLAALSKGDTLYGVELLGNQTTAPGILQTLGYAQGTFRTLGKGMPFAMYHPLGKNNLSPTYFGLAFD